MTRTGRPPSQWQVMRGEFRSFPSDWAFHEERVSVACSGGMHLRQVAAGMGKSDLYMRRTHHDHPTTEERSFIQNQILTSLSSIFVAFHL